MQFLACLRTNESMNKSINEFEKNFRFVNMSTIMILIDSSEIEPNDGVVRYIRRN